MHTLSQRIAPLFSLALCLAALLSPAPARAAGYTLHTLHAFSAVNGNGYNADGAHADGNVTLDGMGHLYGTTYDGGTSGLGTLFEIDLATNTFTTLVNFNGSNGANPNAGVTLDGQGHLYGTTYNGSNNGTLYKVNLATHSLTTLVNFNGNNGASPYAGVTLDGSGNLYGTTSLGGSGGYGIVYKVNLATKALTTLVTFNGNNGAYPSPVSRWMAMGNCTEPLITAAAAATMAMATASSTKSTLLQKR